MDPWTYGNIIICVGPSWDALGTQALELQSLVLVQLQTQILTSVVVVRPTYCRSDMMLKCFK